jgi:hypothetical protein
MLVIYLIISTSFDDVIGVSEIEMRRENVGLIEMNTGVENKSYFCINKLCILVWQTTTAHISK